MKFVLLLGKAVLFLASCALITGISLFVVGGYLTTWPIMRLSPRSARTKSMMDIAVAVMGLARAYGLDRAIIPEEDDTDASESAREVPL